VGTVIKSLKRTIGTMPHALDGDNVREELLQVLERWREAKVLGASASIARLGQERLKDGDTILTFGHSHTVERIVRAAWAAGRRLRVVVLDNGPGFEGRTLVRRLLTAGIPCTYAFLSALAHVLRVMTGATASASCKVLVGAQALCSNGSVIARTGTSVLAALASAAGVPVLVACETYKFHERVQLDAITLNELQDPDQLVESAPPRARLSLNGWREVTALKVLALAYDITLMEHVTAVITELGLIPPTSVPVVLREAAQRGDER